MVVAFERFILVKATALFVIPDLFGNVFCIFNRLQNSEDSQLLVTEYRVAG
ncbi:hypothetical protein [Fibrobacter sp. UWH4]|uniref:hypothetical protein n=1 Tax=Fibrobacter sp. UWH4 TaxID=1896210 RepID=UPI00158752E6|nr:hypothetical protein [Fibrobacter sp. UWH4]